MADHLSTLKLHQLRYGELDEAQVRLARAHVERCAECASRLQVQENQRAAFVLEPLPPAIRELSARQERRGAGLWAWLTRPATAGGLALAAAALLAVVVVAQPDRPTEQIRGEHAVEVLVEDHGKLDLERGEKIRPGDRLQLRIPPGDWEQVWVGDEADWLGSFPVTPSDRWQLLESFSLEVDGQPGPEDITIVLSNHPLSEAEADEALAGEAPGGVEVHMLRLHKEL